MCSKSPRPMCQEPPERPTHWPPWSSRQPYGADGETKAYTGEVISLIMPSQWQGQDLNPGIPDQNLSPHDTVLLLMFGRLSHILEPNFPELHLSQQDESAPLTGCSSRCQLPPVKPCAAFRSQANMVSIGTALLSHAHQVRVPATSLNSSISLSFRALVTISNSLFTCVPAGLKSCSPPSPPETISSRKPRPEPMSLCTSRASAEWGPARDLGTAHQNREQHLRRPRILQSSFNFL